MSSLLFFIASGVLVAAVWQGSFTEQLRLVLPNSLTDPTVPENVTAIAATCRVMAQALSEASSVYWPGMCLPI